MARIKKQLTELIGHTPLLSLDRIKQHHQVEGNLIAKLEFFNPGGSVKDRIALAMIEDAEQKDYSNLAQPSLNLQAETPEWD